MTENEKTGHLTARIGRPGSFYHSGALSPPDVLLEKPGTQDYWQTIQAMLADSQVSAALGLRKRTGLTMFPEIEGDSQAVAIVSDVLGGITFVNDIKDHQSRLEYGNSFQEIIWKREQNRWGIEAIELRAHKNFRWFFMPNGQKRLQYYDGEWKFVPDRKFIVGTHGATQENPYGESILRCVFPDWREKWQRREDLDRLCEKLSIPSFVALTNANDQKTLDTISEQLTEIENGSGLAVSGVENIITLAVTGQVDQLLNAIKQKNQDISKGITSQVLALDHGERGSYALGDVHENSLKITAAIDIYEAAYALNRQLIKWILDLNQVEGVAVYPVDALRRVRIEISQAGASEYSV